MLVGAVVRRRAVLMAGPVGRTVLVAVLAVRRQRMRRGLGVALVVDLAIAQLTRHRLAQRKGDGEEHEQRDQASDHGVGG